MSQTEFVHIVIIGTSILSNSGWRSPQPLPAKKKLLDHLKNDSPRELSAELNALIPFIDEQRCQRAHLVATNTRESTLCRDVVAGYLQFRHVQITDAQARHLLSDAFGSANDQAEFNQGIRKFRETIFRAVRLAKRRGDKVLLNLTGGLKAEVAVAALVAAELGVQAYYMHQSMKQHVFLPTVAVDAGMRAQLAKLSKLKNPKAFRFGDSQDIIDRMEVEGLVKIGHSQDGTHTSIRLTEYGKYWATR